MPDTVSETVRGCLTYNCRRCHSGMVVQLGAVCLLCLHMNAAGWGSPLVDAAGAVRGPGRRRRSRTAARRGHAADLADGYALRGASH
eukprot:21574-Eustigmatos_ZCMA.PRE.1